MKVFSSALAVALCVATGTAVNVYGAPPGGKAAAAPIAAAGAVAAVASLSGLASWDMAATGNIDPDVLNLALQATHCAVASGDIKTLPHTLTVIDYSKPSTAERLWVFDLESRDLLFHDLVAHGRGSGENLATSFSNMDESHQSSLGLFVTGDTYVGQNGYSLRLRGLDAGFNDRAFDRAIVMHGASYVDAGLAQKQGRIGRSWGCPALRTSIARDVIDHVKGGGVVFAYANQREWLRNSKFLNRCGGPTSTPA